MFRKVLVFRLLSRVEGGVSSSPEIPEKDNCVMQLRWIVSEIRFSTFLIYKNSVLHLFALQS